MCRALCAHSLHTRATHLAHHCDMIIDGRDEEAKGQEDPADEHGEEANLPTSKAMGRGSGRLSSGPAALYAFPLTVQGISICIS